MYKNYENRVKEFITEMTNPSNQIIITDLSEKVDSARVEIIKENSLKKPFIFKGYTNELDRIKDTEKNNKLLYNLPDYPEKKSATKRKFLSPSPPKINIHIEVPNRNTIETETSDIYNNIIPKINNNNNLLSNSMDARKIRSVRRMSLAEKRQINDLIKKDAILQPQMRFRARTDLERVYDALNGKYIKKHERDIIERQLKNINLYDYMKPKELLRGNQKIEVIKDDDNGHGNKVMSNKKSNKNSFNHLSIEKIYGPPKVYYEAKNNDKKSWARKDNLNTEARGLLSLYHIKTHFKATEEIAEYHGNRNKKSKDTCFLLPHLIPKHQKTKTLENVVGYIDNSDGNLSKNNSLTNSYKILNYADFDSDKLFKFAEDYEKEEMVDNNNNYDGNNNNPIIKDKVKFDPKKIEILTKMAFVKDEGKEEINDNKMNKYKNDEDENNDNSNNLNPDNNLDLVAKKVLNECNVTSQKSKYNDTILKSNEGKTMITKGMTVAEFIDKYKLKC